MKQFLHLFQFESETIFSFWKWNHSFIPFNLNKQIKISTVVGMKGTSGESFQKLKRRLRVFYIFNFKYIYFDVFINSTFSLLNWFFLLIQILPFLFSGLYLHLHESPLDLEILIVMIISGKVIVNQRTQRLSMKEAKWHAWIWFYFIFKMLIVISTWWRSLNVN